MIVKGIIDEDFVNYKKPSMFVAFPTCTFKCEKECGVCCCQNSDIARQKDIEVDIESIVDRYMSNDITSAIVFGGLEPFDSDDMLHLIEAFREKTNDDIVIYTGYNYYEVRDKIIKIRHLKNIIVKYGRFLYNDTRRFDEELGVWLASSNQYAERVR